MEIPTNQPFLAKVKKVSVITNNGETSLKISFVYYATELIHGCIKEEEVVVGSAHPLAEKLMKIRPYDEIRAIPDTNEITAAYPRKWWFRCLLRMNPY